MNKAIAKPWGYYEDFFRSEEVVFKKIVVNPCSELSLQKHNKRSEFWYVVEGKGFIVYNDMVKRVDAGYSIEIPVGTIHCIVNDTDDLLVMYEMQFGNCSEDDIIRFKDKYGREDEADLGLGLSGEQKKCKPTVLCDNLKKENEDAKDCS